MEPDYKTVELALSRFKDLCILVVGDMMLDRYIWGRVSRVSPEAPVPVIEVTGDAERPGGAGNVVLNLTSLGAKAISIGVVGDDRNGLILRELLEDQGAEGGRLVTVKDRPTTVKTRVIAEDQHVVRVDRERTVELSAQDEDRLIEALEKAIPNCSGVILQDYNKGVMTPRIIRATIETARKEGRIVTVDPKWRHFFDYRGATVFKPNLKETEGALNRALPNESELEEAGIELLRRMEAEQVLITRGSQGMSLFRAGQPPAHIPTRAVTIHDVSGAGDTVIGTLTLGLAAGLDGYDAALLANRAAGYVVGQVGVVPVTPEALLPDSGD